jgi:hypothetical protein
MVFWPDANVLILSGWLSLEEFGEPETDDVKEVRKKSKKSVRTIDGCKMHPFSGARLGWERCQRIFYDMIEIDRS